MNSSHAVAVLVISPAGVPLVRDPKKPAPRYWKLPGGRSEGAETPEECAVRELDEELGIEIDQDSLQVLEQQDRGSHLLTFFKLELASLQGMNTAGNEGEEIRIFPAQDIANLPDFFPNHRAIVARMLT